MSASEKANQITRQEWRELGFYCSYDSEDSSWNFSGSQTGLLKFADLLQSYAASSANLAVSEHEHYGPYSDLEFMTWTEPFINAHAIQGTLADFQRLSNLIQKKLRSTNVGDVVIIDSDYSDKNEAKLILQVLSDDFDPASADPALSK